MKGLKNSYSCGADGIPDVIVKQCALLLVTPLVDMGLSSISIRTLLTVLNYRTSNDPLYVRFEINFLL